MGRDSDKNSFTVIPGNASIVRHATLLDFLGIHSIQQRSILVKLQKKNYSIPFYLMVNLCKGTLNLSYLKLSDFTKLGFRTVT